MSLWRIVDILFGPCPKGQSLEQRPEVSNQVKSMKARWTIHLLAMIGSLKVSTFTKGKRPFDLLKCLAKGDKKEERGAPELGQT